MALLETAQSSPTPHPSPLTKGNCYLPHTEKIKRGKEGSNFACVSKGGWRIADKHGLH